jgi:hypothetical protein
MIEYENLQPLESKQDVHCTRFATELFERFGPIASKLLKNNIDRWCREGVEAPRAEARRILNFREYRKSMANKRN